MEYYETYRQPIPKKRIKNPYKNPPGEYVVVAYAGEWSQKSEAMPYDKAQRTLGLWKSTNKFPGARYRIEPIL